MTINDEVLNDKEPSLSQLAQKRINDHILSRVLLLLGALGLVAGFGIWSTIDGFQDSLRRDTGDSFSDLQRELESKIREDMDEFQNEIESSLRINVDELRNKTTESLDEARISAEITKNQALQTQQEIVRIDAEARLASSNISAVQSTAEEIGRSADGLSKFLLRNTPFQNRIVDALQSTVLKRMVWETPILKEGWTNFDPVAYTT